MMSEERSAVSCRRCGAPLKGDEPVGGHCLACLLDVALQDEKEPAAGSELFDHYQLIRHDDGMPVELGRGAMGVTYKALDVDLRCEVTLKVIGAEYLADESARCVFYVKRERRPASATRMLPRSFIWGEAPRVTSTRWSLWREKRSRTFSSARVPSRGRFRVPARGVGPFSSACAGAGWDFRSRRGLPVRSAPPMTRPRSAGKALVSTCTI